MNKQVQLKPRLLALLFALFLGVGTAWAYDFSATCSTGQTLYYSIINTTNHYVSVVAPGGNSSSGWDNYTKPAGALDIPETVVNNGVTYTITRLDNYVFYGCSDLTSVTIPEGVTTINNYAFWKCPALQTVYFDAVNCTSMKTTYNSYTYSVFSSNHSGSASALTRVVIGSNVTRIPDYAFKGSEDIYQRLVIPASVTQIGDYAFYNCNSMVQMVIQGNGLQTIGDYAFYDCSALANALNLPNSVTTVGRKAFYGCSVLPSVTIGTGLTTIGGYAFWNCPNLATVNFNATNCTTMVTNSQYSVFNSGTSDYGATPIVTLNIGSNVTKIPDYAFRNSTNLTSTLTIPNATTTIGQYAFYGAKSTTLTIGAGVTSIGGYAFWNCPNLATVNFNATNCTTMVTSSQYSVFNSGTSNTGATPIVTLNIGSNVTKIPDYAFRNSTNMTSDIIIPNATRTIGTYAFYGAKSTTLAIGTGVTSIGQYAFWYCPNLATVAFNATNCSTMYTANSSSNYSVFSSTTTGGNPSITSLTIGSNVTKIPDYAFRNCANITGNLMLPSVLNTIGQYAFYGCNLFTGNLTIPNSVTTLGQYAFYNCSGFNGNLTLPSNASLTGINPYTFYGCSGLNGTLNIPVNIETVASSAFRHCSGFTGALTLHDAMTTIGDYAFCGCTHIPTLTVGTSITSIGGYAFWNCPALATVNFNATNCTSMKTNSSYSVFNSGTNDGGATPIVTLTIGENVTNIPAFAFRISSNMTCDLIIPNSVTTIGDHAFANCGGHNVVVGNGVNSIGECAFNQSSGFDGTLLLGDALTSIGQYAFQGCSGFTGDLVIPNSVTTLNQYAFKGCSGFEGSLIIGSGVETINQYTFADCSGFAGSLILGRQVNSIGNYAFKNCSAFSNVISENPTPPTAVNNSFQSMNFSIPLYVPYAMMPAYQSAAGWSQFTNRVEQCVFDQLDNDLWSDDNNWYAMELPGPTDVVCVNSNCHMDMDANVLHLYVLNLNDVLTINSGKSLTTTYGVGTLQASQLVVADGGSLYNPISNAYGTVKKQISGYGTGDGGWYTIASPIYGGTSVSGLTTGTYDLYVYDEAEAYWDNQKVSSNNITNLNSAQGYLYANSAAKTISMAGQLNASNADFSVAVTHQNGTLPGFNLVGNPYTNNISIGSVRLNNTPFTTYYKVANGNQLIASTSATPIKPAEGFMVQVSTSGTLTFNATGREGQGQYVQLTLRQGDQLSDRAYLSMEGGESLNKAVMAGHPSLLYLVSEGQPLAVAPHRAQAYNLVLDAVENGNFTIEAEQLGTDCNYLHLLDRLTGEDFDLLSSSYTFEAAPTDRTDRFVLLLAEGAQPELFNINRTRDMIPVLPPHGSGNDEPAYPQTSYDITVTADPAIGGTVSGAGPYLEGASCTLTATANPGYTFTNWTKNGTQVSTNATYTFTVTENADFVAHFTANNYNITATANPTGGGTVNGGGSYNYGTTCTLMANANTGYTFVNWTENGNPVSTDVAYSFTVTGPRTLSANFSLNSYSITVAADPVEGGTITGAGTYAHGANVTLTATANTGYTFVNWTKDGIQVSTSPTYSFSVTEPGAFAAHFSLNSYEVLAEAHPEEGGTVTGGGTYDYGETATLTATANEGYTFDHWSEGYEFQYFTIESLEDGNTITFSKPATITTSDLTSMSYSTDNGVTWTTLTNDGSSAQSIDVSLDKGDKAIWKGVAKRLNNNYGQQHGCHFTSTAEKEWEVSGNIMSLLYEDDFYGREYPGGGYNMTFYGLFCTMTSTDYWLKSAKNLVLPAAVLKSHCYTMMFKNNTGLLFPPRVLPAEVATSTCYYQMFYGCTSLVDAPEIMATSCEGQQNFYGMFMNCTSLTQAPELRITNTTSQCCLSMFNGCSNLTDAFELPATTMYYQCYKDMFHGCTALTAAPALPATSLATGCYQQMFVGCSSLTTAPVLSASTLASYSYNYMFSGCTALNEITCLATDITAEQCTVGWLNGVSSTGTFHKAPEMTGWATGTSGIPANWTVEDITTDYQTPFEEQYFTIESLEDGNTITLTIPAVITTSYMTSVSYSRDNGATWNTTDIDGTAKTITVSLANSGDKVLFKGLGRTLTYGNSHDTEQSYFSGSKQYIVYGNIASLLYGDDFEDKTQFPNNSARTYQGLFRFSTTLVSAQHLVMPFSVVAGHCFRDMFQGCTALTQAPALPATTLNSDCYMNMFNSCTALTQAPELPATTLASECYNQMFRGCSSLTHAPELPAQTLAYMCYYLMFHSCSSLAQAPNLPAATLVNKCYQSMFYGCSSLSEVTCLATDISATDCTASWLNGVASTGTFHKASGMNDWPAGVSGIPSGWTVFEEAPVDPTEPSFSYTVTGDRYWLANFTLNSYEINASASPVEGGTVTGTGTYNHFDNCTLTATANEGYTFVNWTENDTEVSTDATYIFTVTGPRTLVANFNPIIATQTFELVQGWNWWAPTVKVTAAQLQDSIGNSLVHIKAEEGAVGDNIEPGEMYRIQTSAPCEVSLTGLSITPVEVSLAPGANWFGSICVEEKPIAEAISVEATAGDKIVSQNGGFAIYNGTVWEGTLTTLQPGCGYVYVTTESKTLIVDAVGINEPTVTTSQVTNVTQTTATCGGNVTDDGGGEVTERGICWGTSQNPTISGSHVSSGTGTGSYTVNMTGLTANTTYYVRAYATNSAGTAYGSEVSFTTSQIVTVPTVTTSQVTNVTQTTATCGGNVTATGNATVTERGICWGTSQNPTTSGSHGSSGTGTGSYTVNMTGLTANTTYYVRAYATNSAGTAYGSEVSFTTSQVVTVPTVTTSQVTNITQTTATCGGNVTATGNATVTERGICWGTSQNPTTSGSHGSSGTGTGSYMVNMTGLTANTTYYVRAYATNSAGTAYGSEVSFTTSQIVTVPTVTTSQVTNVTQTTATCGGNVTATGNATVTARGVCWSTSQNPTVTGSHTTNGTGTGSFTSSITCLSPNTTYYVRAYATNSAGTAYGTQRSFTTTQNITQLTVFDGTVTDERVPVVGWVLNHYTKCEYVMPASYLSSMNGKTITSMACYSTSTSVDYAATFRVFIKEVSSSTISSFQGYSGAITVYEGSLTVTNGMLTIEFTTPFTYNGGSLLIGFYNISPGTGHLMSKRFYGVTATDSSVVGWNQNSLNDITSPGEFPNFLPKTTFYFSN